jgi:hypothetical protein
MGVMEMDKKEWKKIFRENKLNEEKSNFKKGKLAIGKLRLMIDEEDKSVNFYLNDRFMLDMSIKTFEKFCDLWIKNKG